LDILLAMKCTAMRLGEEFQDLDDVRVSAQVPQRHERRGSAGDRDTICASSK
jgi:hypothetical protein